jgi:hypothetical protein
VELDPSETTSELVTNFGESDNFNSLKINWNKMKKLDKWVQHELKQALRAALHNTTITITKHFEIVTCEDNFIYGRTIWRSGGNTRLQRKRS